MSSPALALRAGNLRVVIVALNELLTLQRAAARGDAHSRYVAEAAIQVVQVVNNAPTYRPIRCMCCLHKPIIIGDSYRIGIIMPDVPGRAVWLLFVLCDLCARGYGRIDLTVARTMRRWLLRAPDRKPDGGDRGRA